MQLLDFVSVYRHFVKKCSPPTVGNIIANIAYWQPPQKSAFPTLLFTELVGRGALRVIHGGISVIVDISVACMLVDILTCSFRFLPHVVNMSSPPLDRLGSVSYTHLTLPTTPYV